MKFSKDQNTLTLDDGTDLVAAPVNLDNTCRTCMVACRFQGTYDNTKRCGSKFRCNSDDRTDSRYIIWKLKAKDPMETKEEMFERIRQRMTNRRYFGWLTASDFTDTIGSANDMYVTPGGGAHVEIGADCCLRKKGTYGTERLCSYSLKTPPRVGINCLVIGPVIIPEGTTFGSGALFDGKVVFEKGVVFGDRCLFGPGCTFAKGCTFGKDCIFLCFDPTATPTILKEFKMSGVDGSGREIAITIWSDWTTKVKAGCFNGTLDEFCKKARKENKMFYVHVVEDAADAALNLLKETK